jgi:5'-nucleotidase
MTKKRLLLTGDDGYSGGGLRALIPLLEAQFDLAIAGTQQQCSGMGGAMSVRGGRWGTAEVDGVEALWVDGFPADAIEAAKAYFKEPFDAVISGINLGPNIGCGYGSGTIGAAMRSLMAGVAFNAVALSWEVSSEMWFMQHGDATRNLFQPYPAEQAARIVAAAAAANFWGIPLLNVNFPLEHTNEVIFTHPVRIEGHRYYRNAIALDTEEYRYRYTFHDEPIEEFESESDVAVLAKGAISATPLDPHCGCCLPALKTLKISI